MIVAIDVSYTESADGSTSGLCGVVGFADWTDANAALEMVVQVNDVAPYESGQFYKRELPCLLAAIEAVEASNTTISVVVIDGNVRLDKDRRPGLGAYLYEAIHKTAPVIGVAKNLFDGLDAASVMRGASTKPLYVTAAGVAESDAAKHIQSMAGDHREPTLLKRADQLSRGQWTP